MTTIIVWYRNDLRLHDHPALATAIADADTVIPVFITDELLLSGPTSSPNRTRFLLECLTDTRGAFKHIGGTLVVRTGEAAQELAKLAREHAATAVYCTADYTPYALHRDKTVKQHLAESNIELRTFPGRLIVSTIDKLHTKTGTVHKIFTPFYKNWLTIDRRELAKKPRSITLPAHIAAGSIPTTPTPSDDLSPDVPTGGETTARARLRAFLQDDLAKYADLHNDMAADASSRLSPYLHFGCISPLEIETMLPHGAGATAWRRQLCWRDFYNYVLFHNPHNTQQEYQERYRSLRWDTDMALLHAWQRGQTGYPVVDAAMRQLNQQGWMHNRGRLIVGSFLSKDLWLDWRLGQAYFMRMLLDGDTANNNGNWQWIASVGVDPAPVFRRLYNPASQQKRYDPTGAYVRRYVPELAHVPDKYLAEPWKMSSDEQAAAGCIIGGDYPAPVVDHAAARAAALEQYRSAS